MKSLFLVSSSILALGASAVALGQGSDSLASFSLEELVVTASRRSEAIKDIPTAVSAFGEESLRKAYAANLADLAGSTPNVQIGTAYNSANIAIRGIGNTQINAGSDAGVAVHQDGVYLGQSPLALSTLLDVERVEVLRGPQGTLFGRNATGGAVNVIPKRPTATLEYGADSSVGVDPLAIRSSAYLSGPLSSGLNGRVAIQQNYNEGYTENLSSLGPSRLDDLNSFSARAQLEGGSEDFTARLSLEFQKDDSSGPAAWLGGTPGGSLPAILVNEPVGDLDERQVYNDVGSRDVDATFTLLETKWVIGGGELKASASYVDTDILTLQDGDGTGAAHTSSLFSNEAEQTYGEVIYASDPDLGFNFVVGANYFHEELQQDVSVPISSVPIPGVTGPVQVDLGGTIKTTSYAVFGHAFYDITDRLKTFAGLRYSNDKKEIDEYNNFVGTGMDQASWSEPTYEIGSSYELSSDVSAYVKYATGYKSGGFSAGALSPAFDPETNTNIELGLKGSYLDNRLQANLAAFRMKYNDLQVNQVVGALSQIRNAAKANIKGIELEVVSLLSDDLRLEVNGGWLDARFDEFDTEDSSRPALGVLDLTGNRLPQAPEFMASAAGYYDIPLEAGALTLGAKYNWKSKVYFSEFNIPVSEQEAVGKLDLSLRYTSEDSKWNASVYALNVTDEQVKHNVVVVSALIGSLGVTQYQPGRQFGFSVEYDY